MLCKICNSEFPKEEFPKAGTVKGKVYFRRVCTRCYTKQKSKRKSRLGKDFQEFKKTLHCEKCGNSDYRVLEFHHLNPSEKTDTVSNILRASSSWRKLMIEVKKCQCLCANCHRILHYEDTRNIRSIAQPVRANALGA